MIGPALLWLLVVELVGVVTFPLTFSLFKGLPDRGAAFTKVLGLLISTYLLWIAGLTQAIPNSRTTIIVILLVMALASALVARRRRREIGAFLHQKRHYLLASEALFLAVFALWVAIVAQVPAIDHTEKPMDFGLLNAAVKSEHFPPEDMWLAGHPVSYYYFGHLAIASLTKLTGIPSNLSYNLALALIPALVALASYGLAYNLMRLAGATVRRALVFALAAPLLIGLIGNLVGVLEFVHAQGWGSAEFWHWVSIKGLEAPSGGGGFFPDGPGNYLWWWRSTRVIDTVVDGRSLDYTISEFPYFSFLLGDLHAHMLSLPFLILNLALGLNLFVSPERLGLGYLRHRVWELLAFALSLGALAFTNIWDLPTFSGLFIALLFCKGLWLRPSPPGPLSLEGEGLKRNMGDSSGLAPEPRRVGTPDSPGKDLRDMSSSLPNPSAQGDEKGSSDGSANLPRAALAAAIVGLPVLAVALVLFLPYYRDLHSQASAILPLRHVSTRPFFFVLIWGLFLVIGVAFLLRQLGTVPKPTKGHETTLALVLVVTLLPFVLWAALVLAMDQFDSGAGAALLAIGSRFGKLLPLLVLVGLSLYSALARAGKGPSPLTFCLLLMALGSYLLVGAELFYLKDFLPLRMNSVFKLYYQAWLLLGLACAFGLFYWLSQPTPRRLLQRAASYGWVILVGLLLLGSLYYPVGAALNRAGSSHSRPSLDGLEYIKLADRGEYDAILYLRDQASPGRIVEAVGGEYSEYGRVSASTGLPTLLGWPLHELQWRGTSRDYDGREAEVARIYQSSDPKEVEGLLKKYDIRYVYVGHRERSKYGGQELDKFRTFMKTAFTSGDVIIYETLTP